MLFLVAVAVAVVKDSVADGRDDRTAQARARQRGLCLLRRVLRSAQQGGQDRGGHACGQPQQELTLFFHLKYVYSTVVSILLLVIGRFVVFFILFFGGGGTRGWRRRLLDTGTCTMRHRSLCPPLSLSLSLSQFVSLSVVFCATLE